MNQLDALNCIMSLFHASTCFEHHVLIVRRAKLYYTASGIITPIGGRPVHRLHVLHVSGGNFAHHQELISLYLQYLALLRPTCLSNVTCRERHAHDR